MLFIMLRNKQNRKVFTTIFTISCTRFDPISIAAHTKSLRERLPHIPLAMSLNVKFLESSVNFDKIKPKNVHETVFFLGKRFFIMFKKNCGGHYDEYIFFIICAAKGGC